MRNNVLVIASLAGLLVALALCGVVLIRARAAPGGCIVIMPVRPHGMEGDPRSGEVPLRVGHGYGWQAVIRHTRPVEWTEKLTLPVAPKTWNNGSDFQTSGDGRTTTTRSSALIDISEETPWWLRACGVRTSAVTHGWSVAEGDPAGTYEFDVAIDGKTTTKFSLEFKEDDSGLFEVVAPK